MTGLNQEKVFCEKVKKKWEENPSRLFPRDVRFSIPLPISTASARDSMMSLRTTLNQSKITAH